MLADALVQQLMRSLTVGPSFSVIVNAWRRPNSESVGSTTWHSWELKLARSPLQKCPHCASWSKHADALLGEKHQDSMEFPQNSWSIALRLWQKCCILCSWKSDCMDRSRWNIKVDCWCPFGRASFLEIFARHSGLSSFPPRSGKHPQSSTHQAIINLSCLSPPATDWRTQRDFCFFGMPHDQGLSEIFPCQRSTYSCTLCGSPRSLLQSREALGHRGRMGWWAHCPNGSKTSTWPSGPAWSQTASTWVQCDRGSRPQCGCSQSNPCPTYRHVLCGTRTTRQNAHTPWVSARRLLRRRRVRVPDGTSSQTLWSRNCPTWDPHRFSGWKLHWPPWDGWQSYRGEDNLRGAMLDGRLGHPFDSHHQWLAHPTGSDCYRTPFGHLQSSCNDPELTTWQDRDPHSPKRTRFSSCQEGPFWPLQLG